MSVDHRARNTLVLRAGGAVVARWPVPLRRPPDLALVDDLARLRLVCRRLGWSVVVDDPCPRMRRAIELAGLDQVLLAADDEEGRRGDEDGDEDDEERGGLSGGDRGGS